MQFEAFPWHARLVERSAVIYVLNLGNRLTVKKYKVNKKDECSKFLFYC